MGRKRRRCIGNAVIRSWAMLAIACPTLITGVLSSEARARQSSGGDASTQPSPQEYKGQPNVASAGGRERDLPDYAGLFPNSPMSLIVPPIKDFEKWSSEKLRLDLGFRAAFFFQQASGGAGERTAASQDYRAYGTFHMFNYEPENKGSAGNVYFRGEYREKMFTDIAPAALGSQIGALAPTAYGQDEHSLALVQLYYEQFLADGAIRLRFGKLDPDDYFNLGRFADDYRYFSNTLFSAFPAANHPSGGLGGNLQWYINPEWTLTTGATDVQGRKVTSGFNTIDDGKLIYGLDMTYSPTIEGWGKGNYRLGAEYRDSVPDKDRPDDSTIYFNIDQEIAKDVAPFARISWGTGRSTGVEFVFSTGIGIDNCFNRPGDAFGFGVGFDVAHDPTDAQRDVEYAAETFYRFQITHAIQYTIGGQLIVDPVNNRDDDVVGVLEMRLVFDF